MPNGEKRSRSSSFVGCCSEKRVYFPPIFLFITLPVWVFSFFFWNTFPSMPFSYFLHASATTSNLRCSHLAYCTPTNAHNKTTRPHIRLATHSCTDNIIQLIFPFLRFTPPVSRWWTQTYTCGRLCYAMKYNNHNGRRSFYRIARLRVNRICRMPPLHTSFHIICVIVGMAGTLTMCVRFSIKHTITATISVYCVLNQPGEVGSSFYFD